MPWIHTVMYYNLFEDAGGAYLNDDFSEHRAYLFERLAAGQPVAYHPEAAYWVAFDNSVPTYLPLYVRSRWLDLKRIRDAAQAAGHADLQEHVIFSSGWEWGYWQQDAASLRMTYRLPASFRDELTFFFAPWGEPGADLAGVAADLAEAQAAALIDGRLAPYLAGRDYSIDVGRAVGIVSQPDRPSFEEIAALDAGAAEAFAENVLSPLAAHADELDAFATRAAAAADATSGDAFFVEVVDGIEVTALRTRFIHAVCQAVRQYGADPTAALDRAADLLAAAEPIVARRHAALHDPHGPRLLALGENATIYPHGYLHLADNLCYWRRELVQARNLLLGEGESVPGCLLAL